VRPARVLRERKTREDERDEDRKYASAMPAAAVQGSKDVNRRPLTHRRLPCIAMPGANVAAGQHCFIDLQRAPPAIHGKRRVWLSDSSCCKTHRLRSAAIAASS